jgi:hypothetical protein
MVEVDAEKIILNALKLWEYSIGFAESAAEDYKERGKDASVGDLLVAQHEAESIIENTSKGSIYFTIMEESGLKPRYEKDFVGLWGRAKNVRFSITEDIDSLMEANKKPRKA